MSGSKYGEKKRKNCYFRWLLGISVYFSFWLVGGVGTQMQVVLNETLQTARSEGLWEMHNGFQDININLPFVSHVSSSKNRGYRQTSFCVELSLTFAPWCFDFFLNINESYKKLGLAPPPHVAPTETKTTWLSAASVGRGRVRNKGYTHEKNSVLRFPRKNVSSQDSHRGRCEIAKASHAPADL